MKNRQMYKQQSNRKIHLSTYSESFFAEMKWLPDVCTQIYNYTSLFANTSITFKFHSQVSLLVILLVDALGSQLNPSVKYKNIHSTPPSHTM